jgi:hypothetical protein
MDYQCLFTSDLVDENGFYAHPKRKRSQRPHPTSKATFYTKEEEMLEEQSLPVRLLQLRHIDVSFMVNIYRSY